MIDFNDPLIQRILHDAELVLELRRVWDEDRNMFLYVFEPD